MTKIISFVFATLLVIMALSVTAMAQGTTDHWPATEEGKKQCLAATNAPRYVPTLTSLRNGKFVPSSNTVVRGLPSDSCIKMDLPDRMAKIGYVRVSAGEEMVYEYNRDNTIGRLLTMKSCNNDVYDVAPITTSTQREMVIQTTPYQSQTAGANAAATINMTAQVRCPRSNVAGPNNSLWLQEQCPGENAVMVECLYNCNAPAPVQQVAVTKDNRSFCEKHPKLCFWGGVAIGAGGTYLACRVTNSCGGGDGDPSRILEDNTGGVQ